MPEPISPEKQPVVSLAMETLVGRLIAGVRWDGFGAKAELNLLRAIERLEKDKGRWDFVRKNTTIVVDTSFVYYSLGGKQRDTALELPRDVQKWIDSRMQVPSDSENA